MKTLPGDDVRQVMWRFTERFDLQMVVQSARSVARGPVARLVADGARNTHEWTSGKNSLLDAFDQAGITSLFMEPEWGGYIAGPKNMALALTAFELGWVDGGSATCSLAGCLALSPIHEKGTEEQKAEYMSKAVPSATGGKTSRGAFALTEPLPYVGVDASMLAGKVRVAEWKDGEEPLLQVEKRGRFITNMDFADFVTAAVSSDDERIKGSCMVILEEEDEGLFDRGAPTLKLVHQLSSTRDPIFNLRVPASRIIGGYTIQDGIIVPNFSHNEVIEAVFRRTRVTVGVMTAAKLLSAVEPVIRYHRQRFRGGEFANPGSPRFDQGLQQKEDTLHRLAEVWAAGEAAASLGFAAARCFDELDPVEIEKDKYFRAKGILTGKDKLRAQREMEKDAVEFIEMQGVSEDQRDMGRFEELRNEFLVKYAILDAEANVLCPACKLWNTGHGATKMREAVAMMGGYGITEDCPGFLGQKWMDSQLEATYEGPEAVQRRQLSITMSNPVFLAMINRWISELKVIAAANPDIGAGNLAGAMELWTWTLSYLKGARDENGVALSRNNRQGVSFPMADALCWLMAAHKMLLDVMELSEKGQYSPTLTEGLEGLVNFYTSLCRIQIADAAGEIGKICSRLVYGYVSAEQDNEEFSLLKAKVDSGMAGSQLARDRAGESILEVVIPEALDYPI